MKPSSAKAKGRGAQQEIRDKILKLFSELEPDDVRSTSMGAPGEDILLSTAARKLIPYNIEIKFYKRISHCRWLDQARSHGDRKPVVFFKENHGGWYASIPADDFLELLRLKASIVSLEWPNPEGV